MKIDNYRSLLDSSFEYALQKDSSASRLLFLADHIFGFTTYDSSVSEEFAAKALEVCAAINAGTTFEFIKDPDAYRWYLLMVNMQFFVGRLEWGTSVRGAWWAHEPQQLDSSGLWADWVQLSTVEFTREEWVEFIAACVEFAADQAGEAKGAA